MLTLRIAHPPGINYVRRASMAVGVAVESRRNIGDEGICWGTITHSNDLINLEIRKNKRVILGTG